MMPAAYGKPYAAPPVTSTAAPTSTTAAPAAGFGAGKTRKPPTATKRALAAITFNDTDSQPAAQRRRMEYGLDVGLGLGAWVESENMPPIMAL